MKKWLVLSIVASSLGVGLNYPQGVHAEQTSKITEKKAEALPYFIMIKAEWCPACKQIDPALKKIQKTYGKKAKFIAFDVSDKKSQATAEAEAKKLGLTKFYKKFKSRTATVAIVDPKTKKVLKVFQAERKSEVYSKALDNILKAG